MGLAELPTPACSSAALCARVPSPASVLGARGLERPRRVDGAPARGRGRGQCAVLGAPLAGAADALGPPLWGDEAAEVGAGGAGSRAGALLGSAGVVDAGSSAGAAGLLATELAVAGGAGALAVLATDVVGNAAGAAREAAISTSSGRAAESVAAGFGWARARAGALAAGSFMASSMRS